MKTIEVIKSREEISGLYRDGAICKSSFFKIIYRKNCFSFNRTAVLVSKRNGNAVVRNRLKRVSREIIRKTMTSEKQFFDVLVIPHTKLLKKSQFAFGLQQYDQWYKKALC